MRIVVAGLIALCALASVEAVDQHKLGAHVAHVKKHQHEKAHHKGHKAQHKAQHKKHKEETEEEAEEEADFTNKKSTPGSSCGSFKDCDGCSEASLVCIWCPSTKTCLEQRKAAILGQCKGATHKCELSVEEAEAEPYQPESSAIVTPVLWTVVGHDDEHAAEVSMNTGIIVEAEEVNELPPPYWIRAPSSTADAIGQAEAAIAQVSEGIVTEEQKEEVQAAIEEAVAAGIPLEQAVETVVKEELPNPDAAVNAIHAAQEAQVLAAEYQQLVPSDTPVTEDLLSKAITVAEKAALSVTNAAALTEEQHAAMVQVLSVEIQAGTAPTVAVHKAILAVIDQIEANKTNDAIAQAITAAETATGKPLSEEARTRLGDTIRESVAEGSTPQEALDEAILENGGEELNTLAQSVAEYAAEYVADQYQSEAQQAAEVAASAVAETAAVEAAEAAAAEGASPVEIAHAAADAAAEAAASAAAETAAEVTVDAVTEYGADYFTAERAAEEAAIIATLEYQGVDPSLAIEYAGEVENHQAIEQTLTTEINQEIEHHAEVVAAEEYGISESELHVLQSRVDGLEYTAHQNQAEIHALEEEQVALKQLVAAHAAQTSDAAHPTHAPVAAVAESVPVA